MKRLTLYIAFLLLALAQAQAQAQDSELTDMYATGKTPVTSFTDGAWYMIFTNSTPTDYLREKATDPPGIEAITGSTTISFPTVGSLATDGNMPYMLFKAEGDDTSGYTLKSGNGNYIVVTVSGKNSNNVSASVSLSDNRGTPMAIGNSSEYVTIRTYSTSRIGWYYYYGYLNTSGGAKPNTSSNATTSSYQLYLYKVTLVEKHKVAYKYMYNGTLLATVESEPLAIGDQYPTVTLPQDLKDKNYMLDPSDESNWPDGKIGNFGVLEYTIQVRPKATAKEQFVTVKKPNTEAQTGQRLSLIHI